MVAGRISGGSERAGDRQETAGRRYPAEEATGTGSGRSRQTDGSPDKTLR